MSSLEVKKIECKSCKGDDHKRITNRLCPNSYWGKLRAERRLERLAQIKERLKKFEDFILRNNISIDDFLPAFCSNLAENERIHEHMHKWRINFNLKKRLFHLHLDVASKVWETELKENDNLDIVSQETKIIFGIIGSNAREMWYNYAYDEAKYGTCILLKRWGITVEAKRITYNSVSKLNQ